MSLNRKGSWLAAWVVMLLAAGSALAQSEGIRDAQLAAPADFDQFGGGTRANEGFFFNYNGLFWNVSSPKTSYFGVDRRRQPCVRVLGHLGISRISTPSRGYDDCGDQHDEHELHLRNR